MSDKPSSEEAPKRGRAIKLAALSSLVSKGGTFLLQIVAIPIAIKELGPELFGVYAAVTAVVTLLMLTECGLIAAVARAVAIAYANGRKNDENVIFHTGIIMTSLLCMTGCLIFYLVFKIFPVTTVFGENFAGFEPQIYRATTVALVVVFLKIVTTNIEGAWTGYQKVHITNLWGALANAVCGLILAFGIQHWPTIEFLIIIVFGAPVLARLCSCVQLMITYPHLMPNLKEWSTRFVRPIWKEGISLSIAQNVRYFGHRQGGAIIVGQLLGPAAVGVFSVLLQLYIFIAGMVVMFITPLWPAITDAKERRDLNWIFGARKKARIYMLSYIVATIGGMAFFGPWLIDLWLRGTMEIERYILIAFAVYFCLMMFNNIQYTFLTGIGCIHKPALICLIETPVAIAFAYIGCRIGGVAGVFVGLGAAVIPLIVMIYPWLFKNKVREIRAEWKVADGAHAEENPDFISERNLATSGGKG